MGANPPPLPASPWQPEQPLSTKSAAPSVVEPRPTGSSSPLGPIEISKRLSSSADGGRPSPYVCANAGLPRSTAIATSPTSLGEPIGNFPVAGDLPRHNAVVQPDWSVIFREGHVKVF